MSYNTQQDILDFVEDNNVKFVRFAFCDIFGTQKNIAVLASDLPKAMEDGVCFDGSSIAGFMKVEESDLVLRPDLSTVTILPWRPTEGRVMQFFCDVEKPDGAAFGGNCRGFLRQMSRSFRKLGLTCNVGAECEFYLFENDDRGRPTRIPIDFGGYFDVAPLDAGENLRRDICLTMEQMGMSPPAQPPRERPRPERDRLPLRRPPQDRRPCDDVQADRPGCGHASNGIHASFLPKPLPDQAGSGLHINLSLSMDGRNLFEGDIAPDSIPGSFMAGVLAHSRELTAFTNPLPNSYHRFGCDEAPRYVSWSRQNRSQLVRIPQVKGDNCRMELRSPDPACNPYLAVGLVLAAGLDGIENRMELRPPVNKNLFIPPRPPVLGWRPCLPRWKRPWRWPRAASSCTSSCRKSWPPVLCRGAEALRRPERTPPTRQSTSASTTSTPSEPLLRESTKGQ